ncbi:beta-glucuronidase-like [Zophobas morio]|uniref:beta-glucuronidase-like n=1 Tax=Zophobas morio TaxID=2755281 RepID=UPI003082DFE3
MNPRWVTTCLPLLFLSFANAGILYPRVSETREQISLDGLWNFATSSPTQKHDSTWYLRNFRAVDGLEVDLMAVPSSYNDIGTGFEIRDHVGLVWYQRDFVVPKSWQSGKVWIRFSSVCYSATAWINGEEAVSHSIGHLPFQADVTSLVVYGARNTITVAVDNILTNSTIPEGYIEELNSGRQKQQVTFDFFNYAGIDRPVVLYTTPSTYINDVTVTTDFDGTNGFVSYDVFLVGSDAVTARVSLLDKEGNEVAVDTLLNSTLFVQNVNLWWPYLMDPSPGYLYTLQIQLLDSSGELWDKYSQPVGIRTISWNENTLQINNKPVYLRGFGRHEDSAIRGKGLDLPLILRDHNLIKWIGANAYRTSHYPYAEEIMDLADQLGIMIINECPAVGLIHLGTPELLENHKRSLTEMYNRDKNRPSVIMWSAGNEPASSDPQATDDHFREVFAHIHDLEPTRPVTVINFNGRHDNQGGEYIDVIGFNFYTGWYQDTGELDVVVTNLVAEGQRLRGIYNKPVMVTEYGSDTQEGLHILPSFVWTEEYQNELISKFFQGFDQMRDDGFIGEMIWCFADFKTDQSVNRVGGNKKGIFTRDREPKASAHLLRKRYWALAEVLDNVEVPDDVNEYIIGN